MVILTRKQTGSIVTNMDLNMHQDSNIELVESEIKNLESRIDELVRSCAALREENHSLKLQHTSLITERAKLIEKNELARVRVEAILNRLRSMERNV